jgi:hypothetical protein
VTLADNDVTLPKQKSRLVVVRSLREATKKNASVIDEVKPSTLGEELRLTEVARALELIKGSPEEIPIELPSYSRTLELLGELHKVSNRSVVICVEKRRNVVGLTGNASLAGGAVTVTELLVEFRAADAVGAILEGL